MLNLFTQAQGKSCWHKDRGHCHAGSGEDTSPVEALWTFDSASETWQMPPYSGDRPHPREACALAVHNGHAYLLTAELGNDTGLVTYELDLETWSWCLPATPTPLLHVQG